VCIETPLIEPGGLGCGMAGPVELARRDRLAWLLAGEEPATWPHHPPPLPQDVEQVGREHDIAVLAALALLDPDQHAGAVDVGDLEVGDLRDAQAAAIGDAQRGAVLQAPRVRQQQRHLLRVQNHRQAIGRRDPRHAVTEAGPAQRDVEEEPQGRTGQVHPGIAGAERSQVKLVAPQIFRFGPVRRQPKEGRELTHLPDIVALRVLAKPADGHVLDHPLAQRSDGDGVGHGYLRGSGETTPNPRMQRLTGEISAMTTPQRPAARVA
jgi:hypothetical protein